MLLILKLRQSILQTIKIKIIIIIIIIIIIFFFKFLRNASILNIIIICY